MEDLAQKLRAILSDPESMRNLSELAAMIKEPDESPETGTQTTESEVASKPDQTAPDFDFSKLIAVGQALSVVQQNETTALLQALKPHLSEARAKRTDQAIRLLHLYAAAGILRENGILQDLL